MKDFDVVVIGGGPAGCFAALSAATRGCRVGLFEEHGAVGWPRHDPGWLMECDFTASLLRALGQSLPWTPVKEFGVYEAESGAVIEKTARGGFLARRDLLDREIAARAIQAGASLYLHGKVTQLIRKEGKVEGIETSSRLVPTAKGKIFICADGIRSAGSGFAAREGLCARGEQRAGISYLLENADTSGGVIELHVSSDPVLNYRCFFPHRNGQCFFSVSSSKEFYELKERKDNRVSRKIKNAYPLEVNGYTRVTSRKYGQYFGDMVRGNVLFIGDASGGAGNIHGMIQGHFAGAVAAAAVRENDVSEQRLLEYRDSVVGTLGKSPFYYFSARQDFGSFDHWFRQFDEATRGIQAAELSPLSG